MSQIIVSRAAFRRTLALLFSLNLALVVTIYLAVGSSNLPLVSVTSAANYWLGLGHANRVGAYLVVFACILAGTCTVLQGLRLLRLLNLHRRVFSFGGAFVAALTAPAGYFAMRHWYRPWYPVEAAAYLGIVLLYVFARKRFPVALMVAAAAVHAAIWGSIYWWLVGVEPVRQSIPWFGFLMTLAWIGYVRTSVKRL